VVVRTPSARLPQDYFVSLKDKNVYEQVFCFFFQGTYLEQVSEEDGESVLGVAVRHNEVSADGA
jgi:hypothetical protein